MPLKLMYITNRTDIACVADNAGVDRIFVDLEYIGKEVRQHGIDTVKNHHTPEDVSAIKRCLKKAEVLARINPIHESSDEFCSSKDEIESVIEAGADIVMLPYWKTVEEVRQFVELIHGRCKTSLLLETKEAVDCIDTVLSEGGFDEIHIGLNDLHLSYKMSFMFELLTNGTVEMLCNKFSSAKIPYGFGGIARIGVGDLPAERVIMEHYRLGSTISILSRSFCNIKDFTDINEFEKCFTTNLIELRAFENSIPKNMNHEENQEMIKKIVDNIVEKRRK